jgi:hypothetical protein
LQIKAQQGGISGHFKYYILLKLCANKPNFALLSDFTQNFAQIMKNFAQALPTLPTTI